MLISDDFDQKFEAGFVRAYDKHAAKRQFQVSLALVVVLGFAAIALTILLPLGQRAPAERPLRAIAGVAPAAMASFDTSR